MSKLSTQILINKIKLMDKIDCEIESAEKVIDELEPKLTHYPDDSSYPDYRYFYGKIMALQDLKQWIEDLDEKTH